jgi:hypothetical protein
MKSHRPRLARRLSQLTAAALVAPLLVELASLVGKPHTGEPSFETFAWSWLLGVPFLTLMTVVAETTERPTRTRLRVEGDDVVLGDGRERLRPDEVVSGVLTPIGVDLLLRGGDALRAEIPRAEAEAVLEALSLGPDRRRAELTLGSETRRLAAGCATLPVLLFGACVLVAVLPNIPRGWGELLVVLIMLGATVGPLLARRLTAPADVVIGAEALIIRRHGRTRRIPLAALRKAEGVSGRLVLEVAPASGEGAAEVLRLPSGDDALAWAAAQRIRAAQQAAGHAAVVPDLDPAGRSLPDWRKALSGLRRADGEYRRAQLHDDDLLAVLQDGSAPAEARIGAALALREGAEPSEARTRVRIAAEACADEELRAALEAAAAEEVAEGAIRRVMERRG